MKVKVLTLTQKKGLTVGALKKFLEGIPDATLVGGTGHFGEYLEIYDVSLGRISNKKGDSVIIDMESKGEEPD